jgi:hypothetical protein
MRAVNLTCDLQLIVDHASSIPDIILVKKKYRRGRRIWKLKHLDKDEEPTRQNKNEEEKNANQYEEFLKDIEEDKPLRSMLNLYKDDSVIKDLERKFVNIKLADIQRAENDPEVDIPVEELLDELTLDDNKVAHNFMHPAMKIVDMKFDIKGKKGKVVEINKNYPSKNTIDEITDKKDKVKRSRTGDEVIEENK